jgi:heme/copper-type cytochrome/quinol oxidase subunit 2
MSPAWNGIIAELEYRASQKMWQQTRALTWLTFAIVILTLALLFYTVELYQDANADKKRAELQQNTKVQNVTPTP